MNKIIFFANFFIELNLNSLRSPNILKFNSIFKVLYFKKKEYN
jgi:hypothetical protein